MSGRWGGDESRITSDKIEWLTDPFGTGTHRHEPFWARLGRSPEHGGRLVGKYRGFGEDHDDGS